MNTSTLTQRDKKLLYALIFIVIIFIFVWCLIRPLYKGIAANGEDIEVASALKSTNESKIVALSNAETTSKKFEQDLTDHTKDYYDLMDSSQIDKLVTTYVLNKGLISRSLLISMPSDYVSEQPYAHSDIFKGETESESETTDVSATTLPEEKEKKRINVFFDTILGYITGSQLEQVAMISSPVEVYSDAKSGVIETQSSGLYCVELELLMEGNEKNLQKVIDDLSTNPAVRITGFNWITLDPITYLQEDGTVLVYENANKQLLVRVNLYMKGESYTAD